MSEEAKKLSPTMDARFVNAFLNGTMRTFQIQCKYEISPQKPYLLESELDLKLSICGIIGLTSKEFLGSISLCFSEPFFLAVIGSMFDEKFDAITDELSDGAGELLNIIFGTAKTILNESGLEVQKAIPTVVRGNDIKLSTLTQGGPTIVVPFSGKDGDFHILISLQNAGLK